MLIQGRSQVTRESWNLSRTPIRVCERLSGLTTALVVWWICAALAVQAETPRPDELLERLRAIDLTYQSSLTVAGTERYPAVLGGFPATNQVWTLTARGGEYALRQSVVGVLAQPESSTATRRTTMSGYSHRYELYTRDRCGDVLLVTPTPERFSEPLGDGYHRVYLAPGGDHKFSFEIDRLIWTMGRGFGERVQRIDSVSRADTDNLLVAEGPAKHESAATWRLTIDESAEYMVRSALLRRTNSGNELFAITTYGQKRQGERVFPEKSTCRTGFTEGVHEVTFQTISDAVDSELFNAAASNITGPFPGTALVHDYGQQPPLVYQIRKGDVTVFRGHEVTSRPTQSASSRPQTGRRPLPGSGQTDRVEANARVRLGTGKVPLLGRPPLTTLIEKLLMFTSNTENGEGQKGGGTEGIAPSNLR